MIDGEPRVGKEVEPTPAELWDDCGNLKMQLGKKEEQLDGQLVDAILRMTDFVKTLPLPDSDADYSDSAWLISTTNAKGEPVTVEIQGDVFFEVRDADGTILSKTSMLNLNTFPKGDKRIRKSVATAYVIPTDDGFADFSPFNPQAGYGNSDLGGAGYGVLNVGRIGGIQLQRVRHATPPTDSTGAAPEVTPRRDDPITHLKGILQMAKTGTVTHIHDEDGRDWKAYAPPANPPDHNR